MKTVVIGLVAAVLSCLLGYSLAARNHNTLKFTPSKESKFTDCHARWKTGEKIPGVYTIYPNGTYPIKVYCNHTETATYTVIQRRMYGNVNFYRGWHDYKFGFGSAQGDYWAGLEAIHHLTITGNNILRIDLQDWQGNNRYMQYKHFSVMDETNRYRMHVSGASGQLPDDMAFSNGMMFFTYDSPDVNHCASNQKGGWWYNYCSYTLLNGLYYIGGPYTPSGGFYDGIFWKDWMGYGYSLRYASMTLYKG